MTFGLKGDLAVYVWVSETVSNPCSTLDVRAEVLGLIGKCRGSYTNREVISHIRLCIFHTI